MIDERDFKDLSTAIVRQCFPADAKFWNANRSYIVDKIYKSNIIQEEAAVDRGEFKFLGDLNVIINDVSSIATLLSTLTTLYIALHSLKITGRNDPKFLSNVEEVLKDSGMSLDDASKVVDAFVKSPGGATAK